MRKNKILHTLREVSIALWVKSDYSFIPSTRLTLYSRGKGTLNANIRTETAPYHFGAEEKKKFT